MKLRYICFYCNRECVPVKFLKYDECCNVPICEECANRKVRK